jgi:DNA-binding response OmpR family regulator
MMQKILVIDDDVELCELVAEYLEPEGYKVEAIHEGHEGVQRALSGEHALAVLDYMLPGLNGFEVLRQIRAASRLPVVMLTARGDDVNRIIRGAQSRAIRARDPRRAIRGVRRPRIN